MEGIVLWALFLVFVGCCLNNIMLEFLVREDPECGSLITMLQFLAIAGEGLISHLELVESDLPGLTKKRSEPSLIISERGFSYPSYKRWSFFGYGLKERQVPFRHHLAMVLIFWAVSVLNNAALGCDVPMPLHMVFRSGSLVTTLLIGRIWFGVRYTTSQVASAMTITVGIFSATMASAYANAAVAQKSNLSLELGTQSVFSWTFLIGIFVLTVALILSSFLGFYQSRIAYVAANVGPGREKPHREAMFYSHFLGLPMFLFIGGHVWTHAALWSASPLMFESVPIPRMWIYAILNVITQYICIRGVFILTAHLTSLGTTTVLTLRKFVSLAISIYLFNNVWSLWHSFSSLLVFGGAAFYAMSPS